MDARMALSRGGKDGLAASSGSVFEGKLALGPALPPAADAVRVKVEPASDFDVGKRGTFVQEQDQLRSLSEVRCRRASRLEASGLGEKFLGETRAVKW
jgi:hypothetical protein